MAIRIKTRSKYGSRAVVLDGHRFASQREANRYAALKVMEREGLVLDLKLQPPFQIHINAVLVCTYVADFAYTDAATGRRVIEDAKGVRTQLYKIKKKAAEALYGIAVVEV